MRNVAPAVLQQPSYSAHKALLYFIINGGKSQVYFEIFFGGRDRVVTQNIKHFAFWQGKLLT